MHYFSINTTKLKEAALPKQSIRNKTLILINSHGYFPSNPNSSSFFHCLASHDGERALSSPRKTSFAYDFNGVKPTDLTYQGAVHFPSDTTYLRLTQTDDSGFPQQSNAGRVLHTEPVLLWEKNKQANFETTVKFIIKPINGDTNPADGLVFFIVPVDSPVRESGGFFGVFDLSGKTPSTFAVEFDIFSNGEFDPSYRHVGIDIESQISSNTTEVGDAILGQEVTARIDYEAATKLIRVHVTAASKVFEVSYVYDLSTILPQQVQVGISAATGGAVAVHDVIFWSFRSNLVHAKA